LADGEKVVHLFVMKTADITLQDIMQEIKALRREVTLFVPQDSSDEYENKNEIKRAFVRAQKQMRQQ
jgi:hypothetical protein